MFSIAVAWLEVAGIAVFALMVILTSAACALLIPSYASSALVDNGTKSAPVVRYLALFPSISSCHFDPRYTRPLVLAAHTTHVPRVY